MVETKIILLHDLHMRISFQSDVPVCLPGAIVCRSLRSLLHDIHILPGYLEIVMKICMNELGDLGTVFNVSHQCNDLDFRHRLYGGR